MHTEASECVLGSHTLLPFVHIWRKHGNPQVWMEVMFGRLSASCVRGSQPIPALPRLFLLHPPSRNAVVKLRDGWTDEPLFFPSMSKRLLIRDHVTHLGQRAEMGRWRRPRRGKQTRMC